MRLAGPYVGAIRLIYSLMQLQRLWRGCLVSYSSTDSSARTL